MGFILNMIEKRRENKILATLDKCNDKQKIAVVLSCFDSEVMNGGLCQFFVNDSRLYAPYVAEYLNIVGAKEVSEKFLQFVEDNRIDLNDLSSFKSKTFEEFSAQYKRYPFDDFENFYYALPEDATVYKLLEKYLLGN